jgi:hypothetical protein
MARSTTAAKNDVRRLKKFKVALISAERYPATVQEPYFSFPFHCYSHADLVHVKSARLARADRGLELVEGIDVDDVIGTWTANSEH